ncbi:unnamed protein product [Trifolium pratense]|uniref:Uncharacterized protein n=1 Tax=Trifolium pratense TaxID=57577 RepID=A0ACB0M6R6_TRIPR|nr:unnamed protein product [Trifolium pratense]
MDSTSSCLQIFRTPCHQSLRFQASLHKADISAIDIAILVWMRCFAVQTSRIYLSYVKEILLLDFFVCYLLISLSACAKVLEYLSCFKMVVEAKQRFMQTLLALCFFSIIFVVSVGC